MWWFSCNNLMVVILVSEVVELGFGSSFSQGIFKSTCPFPGCRQPLSPSYWSCAMVWRRVCRTGEEKQVGAWLAYWLGPPLKRGGEQVSGGSPEAAYYMLCIKTSLDKNQNWPWRQSPNPALLSTERGCNHLALAASAIFVLPQTHPLPPVMSLNESWRECSHILMPEPRWGTLAVLTTSWSQVGFHGHKCKEVQLGQNGGISARRKKNLRYPNIFFWWKKKMGSCRLLGT